MRIVVTGASGNIGTGLLRRLVAAGGHDLHGVARRQPPAEPPYDAVTWHRVDLAERGAAGVLAGVFDGADAVVHLVWGFQPSHDPEYLAGIGVGGTRAVLHAAHRAGVGHLVHMSSVGAYERRQGDAPVDESWPTTGIPTSPYSRHKSAAESILSDFQAGHPDSAMVITRIRPGIVLQRDAGSALRRYALPGWFPAVALRHLTLLPLDPSLAVPAVHTDDVADALVRVLERRAGGAFNLAAEPPLRRPQFAAALHARELPVPAPLLRAAVAASWRAHLQPLDPGWVDLGFAVPLLDCSRAARVLDWTPTVSADQALRDAIDGMASAAGTGSPVLRPRSVPDALRRLVRRGPISERTLP